MKELDKTRIKTGTPVWILVTHEGWHRPALWKGTFRNRAGGQVSEPGYGWYPTSRGNGVYLYALEDEVEAIKVYQDAIAAWYFKCAEERLELEADAVKRMKLAREAAGSPLEPDKPLPCYEPTDLEIRANRALGLTGRSPGMLLDGMPHRPPRRIVGRQETGKLLAVATNQAYFDWTSTPGGAPILSDEATVLLLASVVRRRLEIPPGQELGYQLADALRNVAGKPGPTRGELRARLAQSLDRWINDGGLQALAEDLVELLEATR